MTEHTQIFAIALQCDTVTLFSASGLISTTQLPHSQVLFCSHNMIHTFIHDLSLTQLFFLISSHSSKPHIGITCIVMVFFMLLGLWRRRQWHPTSVLLPGNSHGWRSLVGCSPWGSWRVRHDWATSLSLFTFMHWRRKWQPTPVFLPGESQGRRSLVGCRLRGCTELDTTEVTWQQQQQDCEHSSSITLMSLNCIYISKFQN